MVNCVYLYQAVAGKTVLRDLYMNVLTCQTLRILFRMYAVYRQAHTPTAVEFSVYCNFISSKEKNLVVAGTSQLFVYRIIHDVEVRKIFS